MEKATIVLYPAPGIGHIVSMVELAKHLLLLQNQQYLSITILLTTGLLDHPSINSYIHRISTSHPSISFLRFPAVTVTAATATQTFATTIFQFIKSNTINVESALRKIPAVKALIIDLFCTSAMEAAPGIPIYYFLTSEAAAFALFCYFPELHRRTTTSFKDMAGVEIVAPGNAPLSAPLMPEAMLDREDPAYWDMLYFCEHLLKANGILVNTFRELEPMAVKAIEEGTCFSKMERSPPPVYYIGPYIAEPQQSDEATRDNKDCLSWLDKQPRRSVVYLCFGSRGTFSVAQLKEIAEGLERSGERFLWVVKRPIQEEHEGTKQVDDHATFELGSVLPSGFMERTKERGLVVRSWAPQVEVLSRASVGGRVCDSLRVELGAGRGGCRGSNDCVAVVRRATRE